MLIKNIKELESICNSPHFDTNYEDSKPKILDIVEKINTLSNRDKLPDPLTTKSFLGINEILRSKNSNDSEISEANEKISYNLLNLAKKTFNARVLSFVPNGEANFVDFLISIIKDKSHFRDALLESLNILSNMLLDKEFFENVLSSKIDNSLIDALFNANDNYLEDLKVSSEINNVLCLLCIRSEDLAKYIVQKGGLNNIIEELKSLIKLNDPVSECKKLFGLKFVESLTKEKSNMEKFVDLNGADLILSILNNSIQIQDEENNQRQNELKNSHNEDLNHNESAKDLANLETKNSSFNQINKTNLESHNQQLIGFDHSNKFSSEILENLKSDKNIINNNLALSNNFISLKTDKTSINNPSNGYIDVKSSSSKLNSLGFYVTETSIQIYKKETIGKSQLNNTNAENSNRQSLNAIEKLNESNISERNSFGGSTEANVSGSFSHKDSNLSCLDSFTDCDLFSIGAESAFENKNFSLELDQKKLKGGIKNDFIPYLVYCFKIIQSNLKHNMNDFIDARLVKNIIHLLK